MALKRPSTCKGISREDVAVTQRRDDGCSDQDGGGADKERFQGGLLGVFKEKKQNLVTECEEAEEGIGVNPQVTNLHNWIESGTSHRARDPRRDVATWRCLGDIW